MEKGDILEPVVCFPLVFGNDPQLLKSAEFGVELEARLRALFREARATELLVLYRSTREAIATGALVDQSAALIERVLDPPPSTNLVSPLEQTMHAAMAARTQPPPDLAPPVVFARNMAPLCYALYLAVECVRRIPLADWTLPAAVQLLFGLEQTIERTLEDKARILYGTAGGFPEALAATLPVLRQQTTTVLTTLRRNAPPLDQQLIDAWLAPGKGQPREGQRRKLLDRISELMVTRSGREQEQTEAEDDDDSMDLSARGLHSVSAQ